MKTILFFTSLLLFMTTISQGANRMLYVSVGGESKVACYTLHAEDGQLTHLEDIKTDGSPGAMGVDPSSRFLFVALRRAKGVATYQIDPATGKLKFVATKKVGVNPVYVSTDHSGKFLFLASYSEGKVAKFHLSKTMELLDAGSQWFDTERTAHAIKPGPHNKAIFVPHTKPNAIYQFQFDESTGKLSRNKKSKISGPEGAGPRHLQYSADGKFVYTADELGSSASVYSLDPKTGSLSHLQTLSTLPKNFISKNTCADVELHPTGKFLYVSNRGHHSIAVYAVDKRTGKLTSLGQTSTESTPRSFNITPDGNLIYVAGQKSGKLASYRIDKKSGQMTPLRIHNVGKSPSWVQAVTLGK